MRSLFILVALLIFGTACAKDKQECRQELGEDASPPAGVAARLEQDLKGYKLIDKKECINEIYWLAIPPGQPIDKPRVIGVDRLVVMDKKTKGIQILRGQ